MTKEAVLKNIESLIREIKNYIAFEENIVWVSN